MTTTQTSGQRRWWFTGSFDNDVWDDLRFPASAINPAGITAAASIDTDLSGIASTLLFSGSTENVIAGVAQMPHEWMAGSNVKPHIHWMKTTSASGGVVWEFTYRILGNVGDTAGEWSSADNGELRVSHDDTANKHAVTSFTEIDMTGYKESVMIAWRLYRKTGATADNYGADARLLELDFHFQKQAGKRGTISEFPT